MISAFWKCGLLSLMLTISVVSAGRATPLNESVVTVHWMGTTRIANDTNAAAVFEITRVPESVKLWQQTVQKLSRAPWSLQQRTTDTNASRLLEPVVRDLLSHESLFTLSVASTHPPAWVLASRLEEDRASVWETNLASALKSITRTTAVSLTGNRPGWIFPLATEARTEKVNAPDKDQLPRVFLTRSDGWTFVGITTDPASIDTLIRGMLEQAKLSSSCSNDWLHAAIDLPRLASLFSIPTNLFTCYPSVRVTVNGEEGKVQSQATFRFPEPLDITLASWNVPANLISQPLASFSALRGLGSLLPKFNPWQQIAVGDTPDQLFLWSRHGKPMFSYFAAETTSAVELVTQISQHFLTGGRDWLDGERMVGFRRSTKYDGIEWQGVPYLSPFLRSLSTNGNHYVLGGAFPYVPAELPLEPQVYEDALSPNDLVFYGWETTGPRLLHWLYMGQFIRYASDHAQLPFEGAGVVWIKASETKLGQTVTRMHYRQPDQLTLIRSSSLGFTAIELHLLIDWLESPTFPRGLHSFAAKLSTPQ